MEFMLNTKHRPLARGMITLITLMAFTATTTSCVSGGYRVTRSYAKFINSNVIPLRILLYLVIGLGFIGTYLADDLVFNVIDFWTGTVTAKNEVLYKDGQTIQIANSATPLKRSIITVTLKDGTQNVTDIRETAQKTVEIYVNGVKRSEGDSLESALTSIQG